MTAIRLPSGDHAIRSTSTPPGVSATAWGGRGSRCGRPRRGTGASISQTCDQPRRREMKAIRRPSGDHCGSRPPPGLGTTFVNRDPSASTIQISSSRTNARRRPSGDHCGSPIAFSDAVICVAGAPVPRSESVNSWRAPGDLGRIGDQALPRTDAELPGRLDGDDALDRETGGAGGRPRAAVGRHQAPGQSATAHQRPSIARCLRTWPWRQSCAQLQPSGDRRSSIERVSTAASMAALASS